MATAELSITENERLYRIAFFLALFTIIYNIAEGLVSTYLGFEDGSLTLFGFGSDSFIEVISGLGIASMVIRIRKRPDSNRDKFERTALLITGVSFYILVVALVVTSFYNIWTGHKPKTTYAGVIISIISILVMWGLLAWKKSVGRKLNSSPILADANCLIYPCHLWWGIFIYSYLLLSTLIKNKFPLYTGTYFSIHV